MASSSKWSSYLQQTLAGVESRLDTILVGDEPPRPNPQVAKPPSGSANTPKSETAQPRSLSASSSTNDRLQERLARAIAAKNYAAQKSDTQPSSNTPSRTTTPIPTTESLRLSSEIEPGHSEDLNIDHNDIHSSESNKADQEVSSEKESQIVDLKDNDSVKPSEDSPRLSTDTTASVLPHLITESPRRSIDSMIEPPGGDIERSAREITASTKSNTETLDMQHKIELETAELQRQEEIHGYIERIDALQAKLQYLARESAESARKAVSVASSNSVEKKLAEKDQQIALLLDEGQKLSKTELKHMTVIKTLRSKISENEKEISEAKKRNERLEQEKANFGDRLKKAEAAERLSNQRQKLLSKAQKEIEILTSDRNAKNATIAELKAHLTESTSHATANEAKIAIDILENEKQLVAELQVHLSSLKIEKELAGARAKAQIDELHSKNEREAERSRVKEVEMRAEQQMLESRLELMRTRAEESSSGATGDAQAKLLRQIETLQTQYAVATENWQGIEASLTARATSLEKERDETLRREAEVRRKAREITVKSKRNEDELEDRRTQMDTFKQEIAGYKARQDDLQKRAEDAETTLIQANQALDQEKQFWKSELQHRIDEERNKWREESIAQSPFSHIRADSPGTTPLRSLTAEFLGLQNLQNRRTFSRSITNETPVTERRVSRKSSVQPLRSSGHATPQRQDSTQSVATDGDMVEPASIHAMDQDDYFENVLSPLPHNNIHDVLSISTAGAGPSVQLVERMSANVRRLESEKMSTKEELARLSTQRDEARAQIALLVHDLEAQNKLKGKVKELEEENEKINARYQTTLEMLGEKSELVDELRADVQDVKDMYRELVERTVR